MVPAGELGLMRTETERLMTDSCTIQRPNTGLSDSGYPTGDYSDVETVACRLVRATGFREAQVSGEVRSMQPLVVLLPHDSDVRPSDRISINGRVLEVAGQTVDVTNEIAKEVEVTELNATVS